jgi:hypothetical protein
MARERIHENLRVRAGLGDTHADVRPSHRRSIADQRDAAVYHLIDQQIVDRREEGFGDAEKDVAHRRGQEMSRVLLQTYDDIGSDLRRRNRNGVVHPVIVNQHFVQGGPVDRPIPDPIPPAVTRP